MVVATVGSASAITGPRPSPPNGETVGLLALAVLPRERILLQRKLEVGLVGIETGLRQCPLQGALVTLQEVKRLGALDGEPGVDLTRRIDVELDVDAPHFRRIEPDLELADALLDLPHDLECHLWKIDRRRRGVGSCERPACEPCSAP